MVQFEATEKQFKLRREDCCLLIDRATGHVQITPEELDSEDRKSENSVTIFGSIKLKKDEYLILATERSSAAQILGHKIYRVEKFEVIPYMGRLATDQDELDLYNLLQNHLKTGPFYFSYTWDLTNSLQRSCAEETKNPNVSRSDNRFFWNEFASKNFIQAVQAHPEAASFVTPMIYGFITSSSTMVKGRSVTLALISRRSKFRAGTRYFTRGIDENGNPANFNEVEQITIVSDDRSEITYSHVQTRGSVPAYWAEVNDLRYRPRMITNSASLATRAAQKHFDEQIAIYGDQILVNLVNCKGHELPVKQVYENVVRRLDNPRIHYHYFDFHKECSRMRWDRVSLLMDEILPELDEQGYTTLDTQKYRVLSRQTSVVRSNCMDCLDRTNVVQSCIGRHVLTNQLRKCGLLGATHPLRSILPLDKSFCRIWADNADHISTAYSGTGALKTDFTRTGVRTRRGAFDDFVNSAKRYILNNFYDGARQDAYDLVLGRFIPSSNFHYRLDLRPLTIRCMPYVLLTCVFLFFFSLFSRSSTAVLPPHILLLLSFLGVLTSAFYCFSHGMQYVNWPRLLLPAFLHSEFNSEGRVFSPNSQLATQHKA
ncbi:inositol polyphosphate phosphatase [Schizosaccharomyces octosporus yFS286]|uniref:Inositol polyphosphate phosphatase n=1 Tax=Schizosaccharomyces octosporus (strain yFS286) TaxID=483514 RepID=S9RAH4_SCHOY|nr:inositol polyphosphate phosphatase [Schizosaccharomyces octosporus yFS286]EPX71109.1 inositol polyphosphate phosphatase [Schizosaccharomyces octosporus yFS286]